MFQATAPSRSSRPSSAVRSISPNRSLGITDRNCSRSIEEMSTKSGKAPKLSIGHSTVPTKLDMTRAGAGRPGCALRSRPDGNPERARLLKPSGRRVLEHERDPLARSDAYAEDAVAGLAQAQLGGQRENVPGARRPERVAD